VKVRDTLSLHDVLDWPPSLRFGEVQWASWMKATCPAVARRREGG
jgi:hypothetical protein